MKKAYYYFFYKIYRSIEYTSELSGGKFWSEWKTSLVLDCLIYFIITSFFIYYKIFFNRHIHLNDGNIDVYIVVGIVVILNYFIFHHRKQWKKIVTEFDQLSKRNNLIGGWIVFGVVILILINLVYSFYLMSQISWNDYR